MIFTCEPVNIMPYLFVPKYAIKAAGGRFSVWKINLISGSIFLSKTHEICLLLESL